MGKLTITKYIMEILFLSATLTISAIAISLHWKHLTRNRCAVLKGAMADHAGLLGGARVEPVEKMDESDCGAVPAAEEQFAAIMVCLKRIEAKIDLLPDKAS